MQKIIGEKITFQSLLLFASLFSPEILKAQKQTTFYIMPHAGIEWPFSKLADKALTPSAVKKVTPNKTDKYGISLLVDFNRKSTVEIGYGHGNLGWGIILNKNHSSTFLGASVNRTYLSISKPIKLIEIHKRRHAYLDKLLKIDKSYNYWAVIDISIQGGVSYGHIPPFTQASFSINGGKSEASILSIARHGFTIHGGVNFQFYKNQKKTILVGIIYQKGLQKRITVNWSINENGVKQPEFQAFTRDSMFSIYLAYPIKLFSIKEKGTNKRALGWFVW